MRNISLKNNVLRVHNGVVTGKGGFKKMTGRGNAVPQRLSNAMSQLTIGATNSMMSGRGNKLTTFNRKPIRFLV